MTFTSAAYTLKERKDTEVRIKAITPTQSECRPQLIKFHANSYCTENVFAFIFGEQLYVSP